MVCTEWYSKLPKIPCHVKRNPWLVLPCVDEAVDTRTLEDDEIYHLTLPNMHNCLLRGSCFGWLIGIFISDGSVRMFNPLTKVEMHLPPISTFPYVTEDKDREMDDCFYIVRDYTRDGETQFVHR